MGWTMKNHVIPIILESFLFIFLVIIIVTPIVVSFNLDPQLVETPQPVEVLGDKTEEIKMSPLFSSFSSQTEGNLLITSQYQSHTSYMVEFISTKDGGEGSQQFSAFYNPTGEPLVVWVTLELDAHSSYANIIVDDEVFTSSSVVIPPYGSRTIGFRVSNPQVGNIGGVFSLDTKN